ncbi:sporulation histidine kinase inhibitor Sda [Paenibacillus thailandensis]|uniref:Sporulation histidine kinase inhibitor Sda n=1 Tax=Paenibacillus thailandensis TaxID=393250 RepID=A0ABW5QSY9_9BACL
MDLLSDELLVDTYFAAVQYKLDPEFIQMLQTELKRRQINLEALSIKRSVLVKR